MTNPVPREVAEKVERYVDDALESARKYSNSTPLDESGVYALHLLAQSIYALGWEEGAMVQHEVDRRRRQRDADADRAKEATA